MFTTLLKLVDALGTVASSRLAFATYVVLVICWAVLVWKRTRLKLLLADIDKIPEKDRARLLARETGELTKNGMPPATFLRLQVRLEVP